MIPEDFIAEVLSRTPLPALIGRRVRLTRSGRHVKGCCPFHGERTPSFYVYPDHWHCYGCAAHGDAIAFVQKTQGSSFADAVAALASEAGLDMPQPTDSARVDAEQRGAVLDTLAAAERAFTAALWGEGTAGVRNYLATRGLTYDTLRRAGIGWAAGDLARATGRTPAQLAEAGLMAAGDTGRELFASRVMFPIRDKRGRTIGFSGRVVGDGQPKYLNGPETRVFAKRRCLYGLDDATEAAAAGAVVLVVEGQIDRLALAQAGFRGAVAPLGTALSEEHLDALWSISPEPVLCFDGDAAGLRAAYRTVQMALPRIGHDRTLRIAALPAGHDPDSQVRDNGPAAIEALIRNAHPLAAAVFAMEKARCGGGTPEARAALRAGIAGAAGRISDRALAEEYRHDLEARYRAQFGRCQAEDADAHASVDIETATTLDSAAIELGRRAGTGAVTWDDAGRDLGAAVAQHRADMAHTRPDPPPGWGWSVAMRLHWLMRDAMESTRRACGAQEMAARRVVGPALARGEAPAGVLRLAREAAPLLAEADARRIVDEEGAWWMRWRHDRTAA